MSIKTSSRTKTIETSITLKQNEKVQKLLDSGQLVYNFTAGQLPFKPSIGLQSEIVHQAKYLKSYQYSPISGIKELKRKFFRTWCTQRGLTDLNLEEQIYCLISNGSKQSLFNLFGAIIDPGDEVVIFTPYWISYPQMIQIWGGVPKTITAYSHDGFIPDLRELKKIISPRTKAIIINSPNNPSGIFYSEKWMQEFNEIIQEYDDIILVSDEVYSSLNYFDPKPSYFYQLNHDLLKRTFVIDGCSKTFAATGLRIGYCLGDPEVLKAMEKIQSHSTSGANSLIQRTMLNYDFADNEKFLNSIKDILRTNANELRESFRQVGLGSCWYQTTSAFYFMLDFARTPYFKKFQSLDKQDEGQKLSQDYSGEICTEILDKISVSLVPGNNFGYPNSARLTLALEPITFKEGINLLSRFLTNSL